MSEHDIEAGARWSRKIDDELDNTDFGILFVTSENQHEPWLVHEAGALGKSVKESQVVPLLIEMSPGELKQPLARFQAVEHGEEGVKKLVNSINEALGKDKLDADVLEKAFYTNWPNLEENIEGISDLLEEDSDSEKPGWEEVQRRRDEKINEVLELVRSTSHRLDIGVHLKATGDIVAFAEGVDRDVLLVDGDVYAGGEVGMGPTALFESVEAFCSLKPGEGE